MSIRQKAGKAYRFLLSALTNSGLQLNVEQSKVVEELSVDSTGSKALARVTSEVLKMQPTEVALNATRIKELENFYGKTRSLEFLDETVDESFLSLEAGQLLDNGIDLVSQDKLTRFLFDQLQSRQRQPLTEKQFLAVQAWVRQFWLKEGI